MPKTPAKSVRAKQRQNQPEGQRRGPGRPRVQRKGIVELWQECIKRANDKREHLFENNLSLEKSTING